MASSPTSVRPDAKPEDFASNSTSSVNSNGLPESKFGLGSDHSDLIVLILKYFQIVGLVFFVWAIGYMGFSVAWILLAAGLYLWRKRTKDLQEIKANMIKAVHIDEKNAILARLDEVPSWVFFPDKERAEWINKILARAWPYFCIFMDDLFKTTINPIIQSSMPEVIGKINFQKIDLGDIPPRIGSIKVYTDNVPDNEIMLDLEVLYAGDAKIKFDIKGIVSGIKSIQFQGDVRVRLKPLCYKMPLFAAITVYFLRTPNINFDLTEAANALDIPLINEALHTTIHDIISKLFVLPNRLVVPIVPDYKDFELSQLKIPQPKGVLRVNVIKAFDLKKADISLIGPGSSDPYVRIEGVGKTVQTKVINANLNPIWNEFFHFEIEDIDDDLTVRFNVFDKDLKNDDFLGYTSIRLQEVISKGFIEGKYNLKDVKHGQLFLRLDWFYLSEDINDLNKIIEDSKQLRTNQPVALLQIHVKSASGLQFVHKRYGGVTEPNPSAVLTINDKDEKFETIPAINTTNPRWDEYFMCFIDKPEYEELRVTINDKKFGKDMCTTEIKLGQILKEKFLMVDRKFDLSSFRTDTSPKIHLGLALKVFSQKKSKLTQSMSQSGSIKPQESVDIPDDVSPVSPLKAAPTSKDELNPTDEALLRKRSSVKQKEPKSVGYGLISLTFEYRLHNNVFAVRINRCKDLCPVHSVNLPDPYVRLYLLPDIKSKKRTKSIKDTLNPTYDDTFEWEIPYNELKKRQLEVSIKNEKPFLSVEKVYMGEVLIDLAGIEMNSSKTEWFVIRDSKEAHIMTDRV